MPRLNSFSVLLALIAFASVARAQSGDEDEPLSPRLLSAETIFVQQTLIDPRIVSKFRSEIAKWEHFRVVPSAEEADLIAVLGTEVEYTQTVAESATPADDGSGETSRGTDTGLRPLGTVRTLNDIHLTIKLPDGDTVWTDSVPVSGMSGGAAKRLVKRLRARVEDQG